MIVREREHEFLLIQQDDHAEISGDIMKQWKQEYFHGPELRKSVEFAAYQHDCGWKAFDKQPFLNDKSKIPYSFFDFPDLPKLILYKHGIDEVAQVDSYAGLLCSEHYKRFLVNSTSLEAQAFVTAENTRQQTIVNTLNELNKRLFNFHYGLLQLSDNLSLYICMNEPGINKDQEHAFFKTGIPTSTSLHPFCKPKLQLHWKNATTVELDDFPFEEAIEVTVKQKIVAKEAILSKGFTDSYVDAPLEEEQIVIIGA